MSTFRTARIVSAVLLVVVAVRHGMLAVAGEGSAPRHALFVLVNVALAALLVWKPRWSFWPALALTIQQMWSHGLKLSESFLGTAPLDWVSLAVCLFFPTLVTILFIERRELADAEAESEAGAET
jgi:hypothetical protein